MKTHVAGAEPGHRNAHSLERLCIQYIQPTDTIHQDLRQSSAFDDGVDHQRLPPRVGNVSGVIGLVERNGSLRPFQIAWCRRGDHIDLSVDHFQSTFALYVSKNHQGGIDMRVLSITVLLVLSLVRLLLFVLGLFPLKLLD